MNKGEIRTRILEQVDWNPSQSASFKAKVDRLLNRAYQNLCLEAPFLFFEEEARVISQKDVESASADTSDRLIVNTTDNYVLERSYLAAATAPQAWKTDGTWDGRMIEVKTSGGTVYRRRIREIWQDYDSGVGSGSAAIYYDRISIDHPWPNNSDTGMTYRIFTEAYELPADVIELRSARLYADTHYQLDISAQGEMERHEYTDFQGNQLGRPHRIFRGRHYQIDAPTSSPDVSITSSEQGGWIGPEPAGTFDFCYTYVWGLRNPELESPSGHYEPKWESAPSPVSTQVSPSKAAHFISLQTPNIDQILNFYEEYNSSTGALQFPIRSKRSGLRKRIYIRRYTQTSPPAGFQKVERPEIFFLLDEVDGHQTELKINGTKIPDYYRRLKETHGYQSIRFWPMPDDDYEVDLRVLRRPQPLVHDHDAPRVHEEAADALIQRTLSYLYEFQGNMDSAAFAFQRYQDLLQTLTKRYGQITGLRARKKAARIMPSVRETRVVYKV